MADFAIKIIRPFFGKYFIFDSPVPCLKADEISFGRALQMPFYKSFIPLDARPHFHGAGHDVLNYPSDISAFCFKIEKRYRIVLGFSSSPKIKFRLHVLYRTPPCETGKILPEVECVGMLASCASSAPPIAEVRIFGAGKPGMRRKNSAPVLTHLYINRKYFSEHLFFQHACNRLDASSKRIVVSNRNNSTGHICKSFFELCNAFQIRSPERLFNMDKPGLFLERLKCKRHMRIGRGSDKNNIKTAFRLLTRCKLLNCGVPCAVALRINIGSHPLERCGISINDNNFPPHPTRGLRKVIPYRTCSKYFYSHTILT